MKTTLILCALALMAAASFEGSLVEQLTPTDLETKIQDTKSYWLLVEYNTLPAEQLKAYTQAAAALKGFVSTFAHHDATLTEPKVSVYSNGVQIPHTGLFKAKELVNFAFDNIREFAFKRVGKLPKAAEVEAVVDESDVIVLTEETLEETIKGSKDAWIVEFYAPWCGHCKKLIPDWAKLATALKGQIKVAKIDASGDKSPSKEKYEVKGFPTIKFFGAGDKLDGDNETYEGNRDYSSLYSFALESHKKLKPLYFEQLTSQTQLAENCLNTTGLCTIFFIPHLSECDEDCRAAYLASYKEAVLPLKSKPLVHFWSQAGDQYEFEEEMQITGAGYPSILALSPKKQLYTIMKGSFSKDNVSKFLDRLLSGKESVQKYQRLQPIEEV